MDGLEIDLAAHRVRRDGEEIHLTPIEFKLLTVLLGNRGRLLTHDALLGHVWGPAYLDARQTPRAHIANLRQKIEPADGARRIHTEPGVGYRWADISPERPGRRRPADAVTTRAAAWPDYTTQGRPDGLVYANAPPYLE